MVSASRIVPHDWAAVDVVHVTGTNITWDVRGLRGFSNLACGILRGAASRNVTFRLLDAQGQTLREEVVTIPAERNPRVEGYTTHAVDVCMDPSLPVSAIDMRGDPDTGDTTVLAPVLH